jgi:NAD(P)-dependent dehydrogenase (short-subunit alcohol dehydrogenase family)
MNSNRVVVVTGGASGMGLSICQRFAHNGHPIAMIDVQQDALERESAGLKALGARILALRVDVTNREEVESAYAKVRRELGPISIVVANAGITKRQNFLSMSATDWTRMLDVNLTGVFHTIQPVVPDMISQKWGRIVTTSSHAGQVGAPDRAHYSAAKAGVIGLTKALARELARHGITANTIPPSIVDTPMARQGVAAGEFPSLQAISQHVPLGRPGTPEDIADACEFLCSDKASYITGQQINVSGGMYI